MGMCRSLSLRRSWPRLTFRWQEFMTPLSRARASHLSTPSLHSQSSRNLGRARNHGQRVSPRGKVSLFACEVPNNWLWVAMRHFVDLGDTLRKRCVGKAHVDDIIVDLKNLLPAAKSAPKAARLASSGIRACRLQGTESDPPGRLHCNGP